MKKFTLISLLLFFTSIGVLSSAALVTYENNKTLKNLQLPISTIQTTGQNAAEATTGQNAGNKNQPTGSAKTTTNNNVVVLTAGEVAKHNLASDCWLVVNNKVYNVTPYLPYHPAGPGTIVPYCGQDATLLFASHSNSANNLLASYYIGDLGANLSAASNQNSAAALVSAAAVTSVGAPVLTSRYENDD